MTNDKGEIRDSRKTCHAEGLAKAEEHEESKEVALLAPNSSQLLILTY